MKRYLKIGITGAAILASGILCAFVLFKMPVIISVLKGITEILKPFLYGVVFAYLLAPLCNKNRRKTISDFPESKDKSKKIYLFYSNRNIIMRSNCGYMAHYHDDYSAGMG